MTKQNVYYNVRTYNLMTKLNVYYNVPTTYGHEITITTNDASRDAPKVADDSRGPPLPYERLRGRVLLADASREAPRVTDAHGFTETTARRTNKLHVIRAKWRFRRFFRT